ncbi:SDR family NAD(P)-dependent oxidoreductase [Aestuariivirga sp.]|uniref:SDR family NAD(P)-dependent oxidoreductase n=1 Tax=Aestuariivirga sp. TaxID=2650926 RepID=UPI0039E65BB9
MIGVKGRVALVTGAGSPDGIGFAAAKALAEAGARVAVTSTTSRILQRAAELGCAHKGYTADLTGADAAQHLVDGVRRDFGRVDILVNNAGMIQTGRKSVASRVEKISDAEWQEHLSLNLTTAFNMIRASLPSMQRRRYGRIVNVSSVTGPLVTNPRSGGYSAAKAGMAGLTRTVAIENASRNITCNAVLPGWIATASQTKPEVRAGKATPAGRSGTPDEVAAAILFLAGTEASYVTGTTLVVDGGNSIAEYKGAPDGWY